MNYIRSFVRVRTICTVALLLAGIAALGSSYALGQKTTVSCCNVTTIVHDENSPSDQFSVQSDDYNGSYQATYTTTADVDSGIGANGGWQLFFHSRQAARSVRLTFQPVGTSPAIGPYVVRDSVQVFSRCWQNINNVEVQISFFSIAPPSGWGRCDFGVDFTADRTHYHLAMGPNLPLQDVNKTGWAQVFCNSGPNPTTCGNWTITPNMGSDYPGIAALYRYPQGKGNLVLVGFYNTRFRIDVTYP